MDHRRISRDCRVKAQGWQCSVGTACPSIGPGNKRGGAEGELTGLALSGSRLSAGLSHLGCLAVLTGLVKHLGGFWLVILHTQ